MLRYISEKNNSTHLVYYKSFLFFFGAITFFWFKNKYININNIKAHVKYFIIIFILVFSILHFF